MPPITELLDACKTEANKDTMDRVTSIPDEILKAHVAELVTNMLMLNCEFMEAHHNCLSPDRLFECIDISLQVLSARSEIGKRHLKEYRRKSAN